MKLIIRDYLASLKEREELDAILPDLLSELGFIVYSRPQRGTVQHGVDVAAVGADDAGEKRVFLFSIKRGDLTRQEWDGSPQGLRSSLNEILDAYIPARIPQQYTDLRIVICLCFGGDIQEQVRSAVTGYVRQNTTARISFEEWNGDKIAEIILRGILREELLPRELRSSFQKAVAMVDEPDVAYDHFARLLHRLRDAAASGHAARITTARQMNICLWVLFVWARDVNNVEAPYRASELTLLYCWELMRSGLHAQSHENESLLVVLHQLIQLHLAISGALLDEKVFPHVGKRAGLSLSVQSRSSVDVNLRLFEVLGRIAMAGLWLQWLARTTTDETARSSMEEKISQCIADGFKLIQHNPTLFSPFCDQQAIEIGLFLQLAGANNGDIGDISNWLKEMVNRIDIAVRTHGRYPCVFTDYRDIVEHPRANSKEYREEATSGSILLPLLAAWHVALKNNGAVGKLSELTKTELSHCTLQLWLPDRETENQLYVGGREHGVALCNLPVAEELLDKVSEACKSHGSFNTLSAIQFCYWPIVLLACRHFRFPVPPQFWIDLLLPPSTEASSEA